LRTVIPDVNVIRTGRSFSQAFNQADMSNDKSSTQLPQIIVNDKVDEELKLQDHHQVEVHIPGGNLSPPPSLDPILEQSAVDLYSKTKVLI
jgi:hypothetical protein